MSEIKKMYMRCKIKKQQNCSHTDTCYNGSLNECEGCNSYQYPLFTAEKQLELIKLLSYYYNITISKNFENDYTFQCQGDDVRRYVFTSSQDFAEQIASFVNMCYELLPETEQEQIRSILNE